MPLTTVLLAILLPMQTPQTAAAHTDPPNPRDARITATVPYGPPSQPSLTMDFYAPHGGPTPHPAVIILHGGGFTGGTSRNGSEAYCADFLAPAGYAVFSINYRLAPAATFNDMIADVQRAVRFVRGNAAQYNVDPNKIALLGGSAGGYLSNLAGLLPPTTHPSSSADPASDPIDRESDKVEAVVTLYGISDLRTMPDPAFVAKYHLLGTAAPTEAGLAAASPITHVHPGAPPFLFIHGDHDSSVPIAQSIQLQTALRQTGSRADLIVIPNAPHATSTWARVPNVPEWERQMTEWLNHVLAYNGAVGTGIEPRSPTAPAH